MTNMLRRKCRVVLTTCHAQIVESCRVTNMLRRKCRVVSCQQHVSQRWSCRVLSINTLLHRNCHVVACRVGDTDECELTPRLHPLRSELGLQGLLVVLAQFPSTDRLCREVFLLKAVSKCTHLSPVLEHPLTAPSSTNLSTKSVTVSPSRTQRARNASNKIRPRRWSSFFTFRIVQQICTIRRTIVENREDVASLLAGTRHVERVIDSHRPDRGARLLHHAMQVQAQRQTKDFPSELVLLDNLARPPSTIATVMEVADDETLQLPPRGTVVVPVQVVPHACRTLALRRRCRQRKRSATAKNDST